MVRREGGRQCALCAYLDERLYLGLLLELRLAHLLGDLARVAIDSGDQRMSELLLGRAIVEGLDHHGLATGVTSTQDDYDFASFHNLTHLSGIVMMRECISTRQSDRRIGGKQRNVNFDFRSRHESVLG